MQTLKEELPSLLDAQLARVAHMMPITDLTDHLKAREATDQFSKFVGKAPDDPRVVVSEVHIDSHDSSEQQLRLRLYRPKIDVEFGDTDKLLPALLYMHGGGFVLGDLEMEHARCQKICADVNCSVIAVDFRLAPEYPFPCGLNDCYCALLWVVAQASTLGISRDRIAVGGCSTGATLAAALALLARDKGKPKIFFQFLLYPALDDRLITESMERLRNIPGGDRIGAELMWGYYLSGLKDEVVPYLAAPARAKNLKNLPTTYLMTNDVDVCRDEAFDYAQRLLSAGVPTELHCYSGTFHAFEFMVRAADISVKALEQQMYVLRRALNSSEYVDIKEESRPDSQEAVC